MKKATLLLSTSQDRVVEGWESIRSRVVGSRLVVKLDKDEEDKDRILALHTKFEQHWLEAKADKRVEQLVETEAREVVLLEEWVVIVTETTRSLSEKEGFTETRLVASLSSTR